VKRRLSNASKQSTSRMSAPDMPSNPASDDGYHVFDVGLVKAANTGLGIGVGCSGKRGTSKYGILVHHIADGSVAQKDGRLRKGDHILEVNSRSLSQATLDEAYGILGNLQPGSVAFKIKRKRSSAISSNRISNESAKKAIPDAGNSSLSKWGNSLDLRTPASPEPEQLADLMTPARHLAAPMRKNSLKSEISTCGSEGSDNAYDDAMSFASFVSQSKLPSAVRVRVASMSDPDILDQAYKSTTADHHASPSNIDGWTSIAPPPVFSYSNDGDDGNKEDMVQTFNGPVNSSKLMGKYHDSGKAVEVLHINKNKSITGSLGMGVSVEKRTDTDITGRVYVKTILPGGAAELASGGSSGIQEGDEVLEVNGSQLSGLSQEEVVKLFKEMPSQCEIVVRRAVSVETSHHISIQPVSIVPSPTQRKKEQASIQVTIDKSQAPTNTSSYEVPNIISESSKSPAMPYIRRRSVIPGISIEEDSLLARSNRMKLAKLSESFKDSTESNPDDMKLLIKTVENMVDSECAKDPLQTSMGSDKTRENVEKSTSIDKGAVNATSATLEIDSAPSRSNLMPLACDIPEGLNAHLIELEKKERASLGISLVSSHDNCAGFFQVRRIMPGSVAEADGRVQVGDYIYSVNGNVMKDLSHPAALQILKRSGTTVKIVVFRDKEKDLLLEQEQQAKKQNLKQGEVPRERPNQRPPPLMKRDSRDAIIPGSIRGDGKYYPSSYRPSLVRHSTIESINSEAASSMGIPHLEEGGMDVAPRVRKLDLVHRAGSPLGSVMEETAAHKLRRMTSLEIEEQKAVLQNTRNRMNAVPETLKDFNENETHMGNDRTRRRYSSIGYNDEESSDIEDNHAPAYNTSLLTFGQRSEVQPFVIEYQRMFKSLGIKVMLDEDEQVMITEISPTGLVGKDGNIRTGDILLSVNGDEVNGKPISKVQEMIHSVPRGNIQLIAKSSKINDEILRRKSSTQFVNMRQNIIHAKQNADEFASPNSPPPPESVFSTGSDSQVVSPPPPPVFDESTFSHNEHRNFRYFHQAPSDPMNRASFRDDVSDLGNLPGPPPPPKLSLNGQVGPLDGSSKSTVSPTLVFNGLQEEDSDNDSIFTALPPPPPKPQVQSSKYINTHETSKFGNYQSTNSDRSSSHDSEATIRARRSLSGSASSGSETSLVPPPSRITNLNLSLVKEQVIVTESSDELMQANAYESVDFICSKNNNYSINVDVKNSENSIPDYPNTSSFDDATDEVPQPVETRGAPEGAPSRSASFRSNNGSISSALDFLDSTLLPHTDNADFPEEGPVNSRLLSPPIWNTAPDDSSRGIEDDPMQSSLSSTKPYGSYTDLTKDTPTHIPIIMGDHIDAEKSIGKKNGIFTKLRKRFLSSNKSKLDSSVTRDSKGREIVHFTHEKVKTINPGDFAQEGEIKRAPSFDEQSLRMIDDPIDTAQLEITTANASRWSLASPPSGWQGTEASKSAQFKSSNARGKGVSLESGIDKIANSNYEAFSREIGSNEPPSKGNRRRSSATARRMSKTSPPQSPAPPPPANDGIDEKDGRRSRTSSLTSKLSSSLGDLTRRFHRSDSERSVRPRSSSHDGKSVEEPLVPKKPSLKKKPSSPLLNRLRSIGRSSKPGSPANSKKNLEARKESYMVDKYGSASSSSTFSGFEEAMAGTTMESVARRKQATKESLLKFDFPPPPATEDSSGDTSSDLSSKKTLEDVYSPREKDRKSSKRFSAVVEEKEAEQNVDRKSARAPSFVSNGPTSEDWGSDFSDGESVRVDIPSQSDLNDPKLQPFSVPLNEISPDFRLRTRTTPHSSAMKKGSSDSPGTFGREGKSTDLSELKMDNKVMNGSDLNVSTPSPQPFRRSSSLELKRNKGKDVHRNEVNTPVKLKSPLFNIFSRKDAKPEKKTKDKGSRLSGLFHSKKPQSRNPIAFEKGIVDAQSPVSKQRGAYGAVPEMRIEDEEKVYEQVENSKKSIQDNSIQLVGQPQTIDAQGVEISDIQLKSMQEDQVAADPADVNENLSSIKKTSPIDDFIDRNIKNPVPKPPRSIDLDQLEHPKEYMNLGEYRAESGISDSPTTSEPAADFDIDLMDRLGTFASAMDEDDDEELRPLPPIPDEKEADDEVDGKILSASEIDELYATVDKAMRSNLKEDGGGSVRGDDPCETENNSQEDSETERPQLERYTSKDVSNLEEGKFRIQLVREAGCPLGITIVGGSDTPIGVLLVSNLQKESAAGKSNQVRPGDQLLEVNKRDLTGSTHVEALQCLKNTPPLVELVLQRSKDGNESLLSKAAKPALSKAASMNGSSGDETEKEVILVKPSQALDKNNAEREDSNLTLKSRHNGKVSRPKTVGGFSTFQKNVDDELSSKKQEKGSATRRDAAVEDEEKFVWDTIEIGLEKSSGKGLGIGVTGGPKSRIADGMTVRKLVPGSIAGDDGRLQKGDKILSVNGKELKGLTQGEALNLLKNFTATVNLIIQRKRTYEHPRSYTTSAVNLRPPSPLLLAAMRSPVVPDKNLPATKSFSNFIDRRVKGKKNTLDIGSTSFDLTVGDGIRNSMYGDTCEQENGESNL